VATTRNYVAVDLGAESGRTVAARFDGERLDLSETHRFPNGPVRVLDTLYWDVLRLWQEVKTGLGRSLQTLGSAAAIGVDAWGVDYGLVARDGSLVGNPVHYRDARTDGVFDYAFEIVPKSEIYRRTGLQFLPFNTLLQLVAAKHERGAAAFEGAHRLLLIPDLLNYFLTGRQAAEYTIASTTQMLDARTRRWDLELVERFGIPSSLLPELVETGASLGPLRTDVAAELGKAGLEVVATAGHDTGSAVAAVPADGGDWCYISSGTWSLMGAELAEPAITDQTLADNFTNEGGVAGTIRFLKNIMGLWLVQECRRSLERSGEKFDYGQLMQAAAAAKPFAAVLDPDAPSFLHPADMPAAVRDYCKRTGQGEPADVGALIRACLEGLALKYRRTKEQLEANLKTTFRRLHVVGGGSRNQLLCQLTADCCGVEVVAGPVEATAIGNVLVQAIAKRDVANLQEGRALVRRSFPTQSYEPAPERRAAWDEFYGRFRSMTA
jgi:rhamnulokinase